jgi:hypothetical protein
MGSSTHRAVGFKHNKRLEGIGMASSPLSFVEFESAGWFLSRGVD